MTPTRQLCTAALLLSLSSCARSECRLPEAWLLATTLEPSRVHYVRKPIFSAQETEPGVWSWQLTISRTRPAVHRSTGGYERLLNDVAFASALKPQPLFVFHFAEGQDCAQLNTAREGIAKDARETARPALRGLQSS